MRFGLLACLLTTVVACAPNQNGVYQPALPWSPAQPPNSNPWTQPNAAAAPSAADAARISELMRRADQQTQLAESQRLQIENLKRMQAEQQKVDRDYIAEQRAKERAALEKQFADKETKINSRYDLLRGRAADLDSNNRDLHARLASSEQEKQLLQDQVDLLKRRLNDTTQQLTKTRQVGLETDRQLRALQASSKSPGGPASISANSSFRRSVTAVTIPGMDIRQDDDLVRISAPSATLFLAGGATLHRDSQTYLDQIAKVIRENYPRQIIGIEAHASPSVVQQGRRGGGEHRLTVNQSLAVLDQLSARGVSAGQMFVMGHGSNHPIVSSGTIQGQAANQRIEVVIYPETVAR